MIINEYIVETCTAVVRKGMYDEIRRSCVYEFSGKFLMGDVQAWIEIAHKSKVKYIDESFATRHLLPESACRSNDTEKSIRFLRSARAINLHYAEKYGGDDSNELSKIIANRYNKSLIHLAFRARKADFAKEIIKDSNKFGAPLGIIGYLYFFGCQGSVASHLIRIFILQIWQFRRLLSRVKWLRALRDRIRG